ncbi:Late embryogenesis abundant hydroxyproline-rich glycoprotein family [Klebsormidium nitens]|uniref:Late embryogenesis abundant hydroxyproline-rich glycoprotein family n=1 Tax=Klebsormidium nitens TaxID=105231 RepID=A0A1Y1HPF0_KLENI|nr:Late embryogenesis abundant hydroxyproline-rich glycoprotein family [Klebsormidium nitens]|eukprot:GAQ78457.1 Late embryogenesis abundant hydroxyproline-rich glycoprotein family [Klebsormidium nitens]
MALRLGGRRFGSSLTRALSSLPGRLALAVGATYLVWPRHPRVEVEEVRLRSMKVRLGKEEAADSSSVELDLNVSLRVWLHNTNVVKVDLFESGATVQYRGSTLGVGMVRAATIPPKSAVKMDIPAVLTGAKALHLGPQLLKDAATGEVAIVSFAEVPGVAFVVGIKVPITIYVRIQLVLDPIGLGILAQECTAKLEVLGIPPI